MDYFANGTSGVLKLQGTRVRNQIDSLVPFGTTNSSLYHMSIGEDLEPYISPPAAYL